MSFEALNKIAQYYDAQKGPKAKEAGRRIAQVSNELFAGDNIPRENGLKVLFKGESQFTNTQHNALDFSYNNSTGKIKNKAGEIVDTFTSMEVCIMNLLTANPGVVVTRDQIYEEVLGYKDFGRGRTIDVHIKRIRNKLPVAQERAMVIIETIRKKGYLYNHYE